MRKRTFSFLVKPNEIITNLSWECENTGIKYARLRVIAEIEDK